MRIPSWFRPLAARPQPNRNQQPRPFFRPQVELLEDRLTPSGGLLDPTFGSGGVVNLPSTTDNGASAVAVQPDGKVVVAGQVVNKGGYTDITVQRLNTDGSLDTTFNRSGSLTIHTGKGDFPNALALQPDGKILVGGAATASSGSGESLVARVNSNGTLDTTFGNNKGLELLTNAGQVWKLAVLTDPAHPGTITGIVVAAAGSANGAACFEVYKLTAAGLPDQTFGSGGFAVFANLTGGHVRSVAVAPSGEMYLAGYVRLAGMTAGADGCLAAVTPAGALDTSFGGGAGYVLADPAGNQESEFYDVAVQTLTVNGQPASRLIVAGYVVTPNDTGTVTAYTLGGALDPTFGSGGSFTFANPPGTLSWSLFQSLTLAADGSIVVGGTQTYTAADGSNRTEMLVGHLTAAGAADTSFGPNGTGFTAVQDGLSSEVWGVAIDPTDGGILVSGYSSNPNAARQAAIARLAAPA